MDGRPRQPIADHLRDLACSCGRGLALIVVGSVEINRMRLCADCWMERERVTRAREGTSDEPR